MLKFALAGMALLTLYLLDLDARSEFMRECQDNRVPHYACVALWRGGAGVTIYPGGLR
jgi:hypothetical protein